MPWVDEDVVSVCDNGRGYNENGGLAALQPVFAELDALSACDRSVPSARKISTNNLRRPEVVRDVDHIRRIVRRDQIGV